MRIWRPQMGAARSGDDIELSLWIPKGLCRLGTTAILSGLKIGDFCFIKDLSGLGVHNPYD